MNCMPCRTFLPLALALSVASVASTAAALQEPNGLQIPVTSPGEVQLAAYFGANGEAIDTFNDAHTTPSTFSPLCGFKATFVLNEAGNHFGLAWYNAIGGVPPASDLHVIVPANSPVGTVVNSADIKNDPAYAGGLIGFALIGGETHYTEVANNTLCTACNPDAPWITALIYASTKIPNAYYIAFEDGATSASGWNNDGDFNDDVFLVEGVTCAGGGDPCDTGLPGVCGPGLTQCTPSGITCVGVTMSGSESCNGFDDNCDGSTDEGTLCPPTEVCDHGACVAQCGTEFPCVPGKACSDAGFCVEAACQHVTCESGKLCVGGVCKAPCEDIVCPFSQVCRNGDCVDPCAGVTCDAATQVCEAGVCVAKCSCLPCAMTASPPESCNDTTGHCVETSCVGKTCMTGEHCVGGTCIDACLGATCPAGQICQMGDCIADPNAATTTSTGSSTGALNPMTSSGAGSTETTTSGSGTASTASGAQGGAGGQNGGGGSSSGCGCNVEAARFGDAWPFALAAGALVLGARRRRDRARDGGRR